MILETLQASTLTIPFRQAFRHASAERSQTQSLWVEARGESGATGHGESCPRDYVTGESVEGALAFIAGHKAAWCRDLHGLDDLRSWVGIHQADIDSNPAAWAAVEMAMLDLMAREQGCPVEQLLGISGPSGRFRYSAVLGDAPPPAFEAQLQHYLGAGFSQFKIKLSGDAARDAAKVAALRAAGIDPSQTRADANNMWPDAATAIEHLHALAHPFFALEEPLPAGDHEGMNAIAAAMGCRIILDESLLRAGQLQQFSAMPARWIINLRISKMGGLIRSLALAADARRIGIALIIGAHVGETSLLTRAALTVAQAARDALVAQEGAFGTHLLEHDLFEPPLMFGAGGMLDLAGQAFPERPGFGLEPVPDRLPGHSPPGA